jgi:nitrite reductase (NADH) large subunit
MQVVIVGNGISGITVARTLRQHRSNIKITMYTDEPYPYYPRPRLYEVLSARAIPEGVFSFTNAWYHERDIDIQLNTKVVAIDPSQQLIRLDNGTHISYDYLVLAMGARPFVPPISGVNRPGVFTLRTMHDALQIKRYTQTGNHAVVIGGGLLGLEVAVALAKIGQQVQVIEMLPRLLPRQLDSNGAMLLKQHIESYGIHVTLGTQVDQIKGQTAVSDLLLDNGHCQPSSLVLISAGVRPNLVIAQKAGIKTQKGILVDSWLQTSHDRIYACGNVAEFQDQVYETIPAAIEQATQTANSILEIDARDRGRYDGTTLSHTLQIAGLSLTSFGIVNPEDSSYDIFTKTDDRHGIYKKLVLKQGILVGAIILGDRKSVTPIRTSMNKTVTSAMIHNLLN